MGVTVRNLEVFFHGVKRPDLEKVLLRAHDRMQELKWHVEVSATPVLRDRVSNKQENERIAEFIVCIRCRQDISDDQHGEFDMLRRDLEEERLITRG